MILSVDGSTLTNSWRRVMLAYFVTILVISFSDIMGVWDGLSNTEMCFMLKLGLSWLILSYVGWPGIEYSCVFHIIYVWRYILLEESITIQISLSLLRSLCMMIWVISLHRIFWKGNSCVNEALYGSWFMNLDLCR
jgi:hypothetical protein